MANGNQLLEVFDSTLRVRNVDLNDDQWLQASLPVEEGGLGIRSAQMLALPTFWHQMHRHLLFSNPFSPTVSILLEDQSKLHPLRGRW